MEEYGGASGSPSPPIIEDGIRLGKAFLRDNGWTILFLLFLVYMTKDGLLDYFHEKQKKRQLVAARSGDREAVHAENVRTARERQQKRAEDELIRHKQRQKEEKAARALSAAETASGGGSGRSNPLDGHRGGGHTIIHRIQPSTTRRS